MKPIAATAPKALVFLVLGTGLLVGAASAQSLSPAPRPGLWETEMKMLLGGQDIAESMRRMQEQMLQSMPPEQRAQMAAMMRSQAGPMMGGGPQRQCLTAAIASRMADPKQALAEMNRQSPQCRFEPVGSTASTITFKGRCDDPRGFTGDVRGEYGLQDDKHSTWRFSGKGRIAQAGTMPGLAIGPDGSVEMQMQGRGRWVAADCGNVKP